MRMDGKFTRMNEDEVKLFSPSARFGIYPEFITDSDSQVTNS